MRLDVYHHSENGAARDATLMSVLSSLLRIEALLTKVIIKMHELLATVTAQTTKVDGLIALLEATHKLYLERGVDAEIVAAVKAQLDGSIVKIDDSINSFDSFAIYLMTRKIVSRCPCRLHIKRRRCICR